MSGGPAPPELLWRKHLALLICLARAPRRSRTRQQLTGMLWADKPESAARHSLNEALRVIRRNTGDDSLETSGDSVTLSDSAVVLDVDEFERLAGEGDLAGAAALVLGDFLEGFSVPDESGFEDWLETERRQWSVKSVTLLALHAQELIRSGRLAAAIACAQRALRIGPHAEAALECLLRALVLDGQRSQALDEYERYVERLRDRFDTPPSQNLQLLMGRIRLEPAPPRPVAALKQPQSTGRRLPLLARETELAALLRQWNETRIGNQPCLTVVTGDMGTGKTRLAQEVAARIRLEGGLVTGLRAVEADRSVPESGLLALLGGAAVLAAPGIASTPPAVVRALAARIPAWAERFPGAEGGGEGSPMPLRVAAMEVLRSVAGERPVLLWFDDVQFLDPESLTALGGLLRDGVGIPLMLLLGSGLAPERPELDSLRSRVGRDLPGVVLSLGPLDEAAVRSLAAQVLPSYSPEELERLGRRIWLDSAGLPLLVVELLDAVANGLELGGVGGAWPQPLRTLTHTLPGDLPDSITAAIRVGFRRLGAQAQQVLSACSVMSERVVPADVVRALDLLPAQVTEALDELEWSRWLVAEPRGYGFLARIIREVVARDMLTPGQRRRLLERLESGV